MHPSQTHERPVASIRERPEDFQVEEIPAYLPSGEGTHAFLTIRKTGLTTLEAVRRLAAALGTDPQAAGHAGMKDRHAVTTQTLSFAFPADRNLAEAVGDLEVPGIEILAAARHQQKLKPGHLRGNRFVINLRGLSPEQLDLLQARFTTLAADGVPNAFGPQRFGRDGANPTRALDWLAGRSRGPRDRKEQRLLFSSVQAMLFNEVLARRVEEGTWAAVLAGDLAKKHDTGGLFLVPSEGGELAEAQARARAGLISPTGPIFGPKMRQPMGEVAEIEREVLGRVFGPPTGLASFKRLGMGTRRALRLPVAELSTTPYPSEGYLNVTFVLPKGGYATTVLGQVCELKDLGPAVLRKDA